MNLIVHGREHSSFVSTHCSVADLKLTTGLLCEESERMNCLPFVADAQEFSTTMTIHLLLHNTSECYMLCKVNED